MDHINLFQTNAEFLSAYNGSDYVEPWVSFTMETSGMAYNKESGPTPPPHDYSQDYLTLEILSSGSIEPYYDELYYSLDDGQTWTLFTSNINVNNGDKFMVKGDNATGLPGSWGPFKVHNCEFNACGNVMSIVNSSDFTTMTSFPTDYYDGLSSLFQECSGLISAENLVLPATTLVSSCYGEMFHGCTSLTTAPELPATTLAYSCYNNMFIGCRSLTSAPAILPATTLADWCYVDMFEGCTSLTEAPALPATTLTNGCYYRMFQGCTSINYIKCLATNILATDCTSGWVDGVASSGTFVKNPNMSSWTTGINGIPTNWTVQDAS